MVNFEVLQCMEKEQWEKQFAHQFSQNGGIGLVTEFWRHCSISSLILSLCLTPLASPYSFQLQLLDAAWLLASDLPEYSLKWGIMLSLKLVKQWNLVKNRLEFYTAVCKLCIFWASVITSRTFFPAGVEKYISTWGT